MFNTINMRAMVAILAIFTFLSSPVKVGAENKESPLTLNPTAKNPWIPSGQISVFYGDAFFANRVSRVFTTDPSVSLEVKLEWPSGVYFSWLEVHGTYDTDWSTDVSDETHVVIGYTWKNGPYKFKLQTELINIFPIEHWFDHDRIALDGIVSRTWKFNAWGKQSITPELRLSLFADTNNLKGAVPMVMPAVYHRWDEPFGLKFLAVQSRGAISWDGGLYKNSASGVFLQFDSGLQWKIGANTTITLPGYKIYVPLNGDIKDGREHNAHTFFGGVQFKF